MSTPNQTITHRGRTYKVEVRAVDPEKNQDRLESVYLLIGERGVRYALLRNVPKPDRMFAVYFDKFGMPSGQWWFTDEGGMLRSLTP
ncbi:MAG TPA: hypothetical protein VNU68_19125 [Verrucomicrobiae bacterium]|nr:hypothetical protein [Verrucomicrobiae bacterium]